ncbi:MAG: SAM-dependent methyltransferase, partial [Gammaproteobacteria bacterium]|nr:SAM-dependent methyltransferase [Gammaproteobacteria bacterium]
IAAQKGLISFSTFMTLALYHPQWGYYNADNFKIGAAGDFTTASEISPLYAQCFAKQCLALFPQLDTNNILELGAGSGRFAKDLLFTLEKNNQLPEKYFIYEISENLRKQQQIFLKSTCPNFAERIHWLEELPSHFTGIIIANEVLDALPTHCFRIENNDIYERSVTYHHNEFAWRLQKPTQDLAEKARILYEQYAFANAYELEINLHVARLIKALANTLSCGILFFADYGYGQQELYHPERRHGSLTCFYKHHKHHNPLIFPGLQDITTHVDFTTVAESAIDCGLKLQAYTSQSAFLLANGLLALAAEAEKNLSSIEEFHLHQAIKTLTLPTEMGDRIKIMVLSKNKQFVLPNFTFQDRRREL